MTPEPARAAFLEAYRFSGYAALAAGLAALRYFDPYFTMTILTIPLASWTFRAAMTRDEIERALVRERRGPLIAAAAGCVLAGLHILDISLGVFQ